jgi:uncharacterized membrane protein
MSRRALPPVLLVLAAGLSACDTHPTEPIVDSRYSRLAAPVAWSGPEGLGVPTRSVAYAANNAGVIVGDALSSSPQRAFRRAADGTVTDLVPVRAGANSNARAVNQAGYVVGNDFTTGFAEQLPHYSRPVRWAPDGTPTVLIDQDGYAAWGMNELGHVVGTSLSGAWRWTPETGLQMLPGTGCMQGACGIAHDINDAGAVVGQHRVPFDFRPFFWSAATGLILIAPTNGEARAINAHGQVTGTIGGGTNRAFRWSQAEGLMLIERPEGATEMHGYGINDDGSITGYLDGVSTGVRAFVWTEADGVTILGSLPGGNGRSRGLDIDNAGNVVGWSHPGGTATDPHAVRWAAVPPPPNQPPVIRPMPGEQEVTAGETLVFDVEADDADGDRIEIQAIGLPAGATFTEEEATAGYTRGRFAWTPEPGQEGSYTVTFSAIDEHGAQSAPATVTIRVDPPSIPQCTNPGLSLETWSGSTPGRISLSDPTVWVVVWNIEPHVPTHNPRAAPSDLRFGDAWETATRSASFVVRDLNDDGNRDVRMRFETARLVADGNLDENTDEVTILGRDPVTGELFCGTATVSVEP